MDARKKISDFFDKIPSFRPKTDFRGLYESYIKTRGFSPFEEEELGFLDEKAPSSQLRVVDKIPAPSPKDQYVLMAEIGKPLMILRYDAEGKQVPFDSSRVRVLLQELDSKTKVEKESRSDSEIRKARITDLVKSNNEKIAKYKAQLVPLQKGERTKKKSDAISSIETQLDDLEKENDRLKVEKSTIELTQMMGKIENDKRIQNIKKSHGIDEIRRALPTNVTIDKNATAMIVEKLADSIETMVLNWEELNEGAKGKGMSAVQLLADHLSGMDSKEYEAAKNKLATFERAVDEMIAVDKERYKNKPFAGDEILSMQSSAKQVISEMSKAIALSDILRARVLRDASRSRTLAELESQLEPTEKIVYQHTLEIIQAMKTNDIKKVVLATERLGQFLSEPKNSELSVSEMKSVKKLLAEEMPVSSVKVIEIMEKAVVESKDTVFKDRMKRASDALRYEPTELTVERLRKGVELSEIKLAKAKVPCVFIMENKNGKLSGCYVAGDGKQNPFEIIEKQQKKYVDKHFKKPGIFNMKEKSSKSREFIDSLAVKAESRRVRLEYQKSDKIKEAKEFIEKNLIPKIDQRKNMEKLIENLEVECVKFTNNAAKDRAMLLVKELRKHVTEYYSASISDFTFSNRCKKSIEAAQQDIDKNATPGWRGALEALKYFISKLTLSKSKEKLADINPNPHTFYSTSKRVTQAISAVEQKVKEVYPYNKTLKK